MVVAAYMIDEIGKSTIIFPRKLLVEVCRKK
jgi:hypothetical protein